MTWLLASTIVALSHCKTLKRVNLDYMGWHDQYIYERGVIRSQNFSIYTNYCFRQLEELEIASNTSYFLRLRMEDEESNIDPVDGHLAQHLNQGVNVVSLKLHVDLDPVGEILYGIGVYDFMRSQDQDAVYRALHLPQLKTMWTTAFDMRKDTFIAWMKRHSSTLRSLECYQGWLYDERLEQQIRSIWEQVIKHLAPNLQLDHVNLGFIADEAIKMTVLDKSRERYPEAIDATPQWQSQEAFSRAVSAYIKSKGQSAYPSLGSTTVSTPESSANALDSHWEDEDDEDEDNEDEDDMGLDLGDPDIQQALYDSGVSPMDPVLGWAEHNYGWDSD